MKLSAFQKWECVHFGGFERIKKTEPQKIKILKRKNRFIPFRYSDLSDCFFTVLRDCLGKTFLHKRANRNRKKNVFSQLTLQTQTFKIQFTCVHTY
jgi:hypothetical protein